LRERALALVKVAINELNEELDYDSLRKVSEDTPLYGGDAGIDSLSLVALVVGLEQEVEKTFGRRVSLADQKAVSLRHSPYRTAGSLADLIAARLEIDHA
jgi:acyl carrier protein